MTLSMYAFFTSPTFLSATLLNALLITVFTGLGYLLGKITCNSHTRTVGMWLTFAVFILVNGLHSFIDGISLSGIGHGTGIGLMIGHELLRQPIMYIIFLGMMAPFSLGTGLKNALYARYLLAFFAVTGIWIITVFLGSQVGSYLNTLIAWEPYIKYLQFLFVGDIIHHIIDYVTHKVSGVNH
jgi:hypothetical protein